MKYLLLILVLFTATTTSLNAAQVGKVQSLVATTLSGGNFDLKEKHGKVVLVSFWAKWCGDCRKEMLVLDRLYRGYKNHGLEIIGVNIDRIKDRREVIDLSSQFLYQNAMLSDVSESSFEEPSSIPIVYVINKSGILEAILSSPQNQPTLQNLEPLIKSLL